MKRLLTLLMTVVMLMSIMAVAGAETEFDPRSVCEGVTITIAVPERPRISDWKGNEMTKYIEDALGVNLEFEVYPAADYVSKINAMVMVGDELPDLIFGINDTYINWVSEGALLELSEFYADPNLSANIRKASEGAGFDIGTYMKNGDGYIFALPRLEQGLGMQSWQRFWIYKPWLDQLEVEVPTTIDEFYDICKAVYENDMNGNGDTTDEYVIIGNGFNTNGGWSEWFEPLMSAFVYAWDPNFITVNNGILGFAYTTDEWKEGLHYIKKFFDEGLIGTEILTNTMDDTRAILYRELPTALSFTGWIYEGADPEIKVLYTYVPGLKNSQGENGHTQYMPLLPSAAAVISADCEHPEVAFLVCDLMCGEYLSLITRYGREGEHWAYWDQVLSEDVLNPDGWAPQGGDAYEIEWISAYADHTFWSSQATTTASWLQLGPYVRNAQLQCVRARAVAASTRVEELAVMATNIDFESKFAGIANAPAEVMDYYPLTDVENAETAEILITANNYVSEMTAAFLTGRKDIDADWDDYLAELEVIGIEQLLEVYQEAYSRVH